MNRQPKISIITPSLNCARYIRDCIESVLAQEYDNFEHIVVDGASTDGTVEILQEYPHLRWISEPDRGEAEAVNKALRMVTGDIIGWLNADDCYVEGVFHRVAAEIDPHRGRHLVYGKTVFLDERGRPTHWVIPIAPVNVITLTRWFTLNLFQPSMFFSRELVQDVGFFREDLRYGTDYDYWFRIAVKGYTFHFVDRVLSKARIYRPGGKTETPYAVKAQEWLEISKAYHRYLTPHERTFFWKDYYLFRLRHARLYDNRFPEVPDPEDKHAFAGLLLTLQELGLSTQRLLPFLTDLTASAADMSDLFGLLGFVLQFDGHWAEAGRMFERAMKLETPSPPPETRRQGEGETRRPTACKCAVIPRVPLSPCLLVTLSQQGEGVKMSGKEKKGKTMLIGVDFDNTIVCYDQVFHRVAVEQGLIPPAVPVTKDSVRDYLRRCGQEAAWTELQGLVYGLRMGEAPAFPGVREFFARCATQGITVCIISHKTRYPFRGPRYDLHRAAQEWLEARGFYDAGGLHPDRVYFEGTREAKLARIAQVGCTHFVDDLPEFLAAPGFPAGVERILFDPHDHHVARNGFRRVRSWREVEEVVCG